MTLFQWAASRRGVDTFPNIKAAGKVRAQGEGAQTCLQEITPRPVTPPAVRKFLNSRYPEPGRIRVFYGKASDPDIASALVHGIHSRSSLSAGSLIIPPPRTHFQERLREIQEAKKAPLGRSQIKGPGLPNGVDAEKTTFGVKSVFSSSAGEVINPPKTAGRVEEEAQEGHELYVRSHNSYDVVSGEQVNRSYDRGTFRKDSRFGVATPHHRDGRSAAASFQWLCDIQKNHSAKFVSKRCDDFRERTQPQIGKVHDPIADTLKVPDNHTFGLLMAPDKYGAGELLHSTPPSESRTLMSAVQQKLKKTNFQNFPSLLRAFRYYDRKQQGRIDKDDLREGCRQLGLDLRQDVLDDLMDYCDLDQDGFISFLEFANFLNWKDSMPISSTEQGILAGLLKPEDLEPVKEGSALKKPKTLSRGRAEAERFITSSSEIRASVGDLPPPGDHRPYGVPTVRTDRPPPPIKRISDRTNYGDQATAYDLLFPPLHALYGVHEEHFFCPRTKDQMEQILRNAGVHVSTPVFEKVWSLASVGHPAGEVCVQSFRNVLTELQTNEN